MMRGRSEVRPLVLRSGAVICGKCAHPMSPEEFIDFEIPGRKRWLFWRCEGPEGHVTVMLPLP